MTRMMKTVRKVHVLHLTHEEIIVLDFCLVHINKFIVQTSIQSSRI